MTGYYVAASHRPSLLNAGVEEIHDTMLAELTEGCEDGIKCGIIGEIGCSWPLHGRVETRNKNSDVASICNSARCRNAVF